MSDATVIELVSSSPDAAGQAATVRTRPAHAWHALWTRSHCEDLVCDQLRAKSLDVFLPKVDRWSRRGGLEHLIQVPLFPGYVFLYGAMDKASYLEIVRARGLVRVLGERWDRLATIPDREIEAIRRIIGAKIPTLPYPYLRDGQRVRITHGPLADLEGVLVRTKPNRGMLVVSVGLLRRSVAVQVHCTSVTPA